MKMIDELIRYNRGRDPERLALKLRRMRQGAFPFLRGSCHWLAARLAEVDVAAKGPVGWICGDLHLENFGSFKGENRLVYFDLNDFDEALLAPAAWDLLHLLTSLHVAGAEHRLAPERIAALTEATLTDYFDALATGKPMWVERETATGPVRALLAGLRDRCRADLLASRTDLRGRRRRLRIDGIRALPVDAADRARAERIVQAHGVAQNREAFFEVLDVARRIAGTGSLGLERYVVLVRGKGGPDGHHLVDLKRAVPAASADWLRTAQPAWSSPADRVVTLQRRLQAVPMAFVSARHEGRRSYLLRELQPAEDRLTLSGRLLAPGPMTLTMQTMAQCTAWAHLRGAGRQGADPVDAWIEWGRAQRRRKSLLAAAETLARQVQRDWQRYAQAYDDGVFSR